MSTSITALLPIREKFDFYAPDRNFRVFDGRPIYQVMIDKLMAVSQIDRIVINTDAQEVKDFCSSNSRITIIDRPEELRGDDVPSDKITAYDLEKVSGEHFIEVQSFNPLLTKYSIEAVIHQYFQFIIDVNAEESYFDSIFSMQRHEMRSYDLDKRELMDEYPFVIFENRILHVFNRKNFLSQGNHKVGKMAMMFEVKEVENTLVDSDTNYELVKLVHANQDKFPGIFHSGI